jgi:FtsP/CotA-like multicopper oxidase with cupredoxin domain
MPRERSFLPLLSAAVAVVALVVAGLAVVASNDNETVASGGGAAAQIVDITLSEYAITPNHIMAPPGQVSFRVTNSGSLEHNFEIRGVTQTPNIRPGETTTLDVELEAGEYGVLCNIPGHEGSGMVATLMVAEGASSGGGAAAGATTTAVMDPEQMEASMKQVANEFLQVNGLAEPRIEIKDFGREGEVLEPRIAADGAKEFDLTAQVVDWEVEPGKIVKAWTYNGIVPGPTIRVNEGDKVRIKLTNQLPEYTSLHPHGCSVPNAMDGFDPYTQDPIAPGATFTYEWVAKGPKVCMYHSHHNAQVQVPNGLLGALYIGKVTLPAGKTADTEVTMVLNDAGTIGLSLNGRSFPATNGYVVKNGSSMLVHYFNEGLQIHPMHLHQPHGLIVAKDGVEIDQPYYSDTVNVAPGERYSVLYEFTEPGVWAWHCHILTHAETPAGFRYMATAVVVQ